MNNSSSGVTLAEARKAVEKENAKEDAAACHRSISHIGIQDGFSTTNKGGLGSVQTSKRHKDCSRKRRVLYREYCRKITPL